MKNEILYILITGLKLTLIILFIIVLCAMIGVPL
jgi:hypothetical protein